MNDNLFSALRDAFPSDLDSVAIETADGERLDFISPCCAPASSTCR